MTGSPIPVLSAGETRAAEAPLARAWGEPAVVQAAEPIWAAATSSGCAWQEGAPRC